MNNYSAIVIEIEPVNRVSFFQAYLDDIIIHSRTPEEHLGHLEQVLAVHLSAGLRLQPHKSLLLRAEALYLGHIISSEGVRPDPEKIQVIQDWEESDNITNLQAFLGLCNYYRVFVDDYSRIALPFLRYLENSPKKKAPIILDQDARDAFQELKKRLVQCPILSFPDFEENSRPFLLDTDWSQDHK